MDRQPIQSSSIVSAGWDGKDLELEFSSKAVYLYRNVPEKIWQEFLAAASKGHYFAMWIRWSYAFECVYRPPRPKLEKTNGKAETKKATKKAKQAGPIEKRKTRRIS